MDVSTNTVGFNELKAAFKAMPEQIQNQVLASGVLAGAKVVARQAVNDAPRGNTQHRSQNSFIYGRLFANIKARALRKRKPSSRAAIVTRGRAYWGDLLNRGTRYVPATHWYDNSLKASAPVALQTMKEQMVKKIKSVSESAIKRAGAGKK